MAQENFADPRALWDQRFARVLQCDNAHAYQLWLEPWAALLDANRDQPILDLGCGSGADTRYLLARGHTVIAADLSSEGLRLTARRAPNAVVNSTSECGTTRSVHRARPWLVQLDVRSGLPFRHGSFRTIVANLSLHYHRWIPTLTILAQVRQCLELGGILLARFNSTRDTAYGAWGHPEVERNCYRVNGELKRFFDRADLETAFASGWRVRAMHEHVVHCYTQPKTVWEVVTEKISLDSQVHGVPGTR